MKVPLTKVYERLDFVSDRLSTQIRTLTLGVLALVWLFLSAGKNAPAISLIAGNKQLLGIATLCVLTLLLDASQYWASYVSSNAVRKEVESKNLTQADYDETSFLRRLQVGCFWAKQFTAIVATAWLLLILFLSVTT